MKNKTIIFFNCYYAFTIFYYCFGKWNWSIPSYPKLLAYIFICYFALNLGYRKYLPKNSENNDSNNKNIFNNMDYKKVRKIFLISSLLIIIFQISWVYVFLKKFSISNVLTTLGSNYYERLNVSFDSKVLIMQLRTIFWGFTFFAYPIGFLYFKKMPVSDKLVFILAISVDCLAALNMGISKNLGDIVIIAIGMTFLKNKTLPKQKKKKNRMIYKVSILLLLFIIAFGKIQDLRSDYKKVSINIYGKFATVNDNTIYYYLFGNDSEVSKMIDKIGGYVSNSYTGLAYALEIPFKNTYLMGASRALMEYGEQYLHMELKNKTYNSRIDTMYGWKDGQWWPTAFVWIANSVSFFGVPIILFLLGRFIKKLEYEYQNNCNIISAVMYGQMLIMLFYLPCNMQLLQARQALLGFIFLIFVYLNKNKKIMLKNR